MRCRWARIVTFGATCLLAGHGIGRAQSVPLSEIKAICSGPPDYRDATPSRLKVAIASVTFPGSLKMPLSTQREIAASITRLEPGDSLDEVEKEAIEGVRNGWMDRGYFRVEVRGKTKRLSGAGPGRSRVAVTANVVEGEQYRLGEITFRNNKAIPDSSSLRRLFPIEDGEVMSRKKIVKGIENLRNAYGELGYLNYTGVPDTKFIHEDRIVNIDFDIDEGRQFRVSDIQIVGLDERSQQEILKDFPAGDIFNQEQFKLFLEKYSAAFKLRPDDPRLTDRQIDQRTGAVSIVIYACPCATCYAVSR